METRDDPSLRGKPLAVGGRADHRGVVATCNYEARAFGIHSAMPTAQALKRCPELTVLPPAMEKYRQASRSIFAIYERYTERIEPLSLDEAYLDVSDSGALGGDAVAIARGIKACVAAEVGITISAGVAPNKFLAKIASAWQKPDGLTVIPDEAVDAFVAGLPVERLHGVGKVTAGKLHQLGFRQCGDIRQAPRSLLVEHFGVLGDRLAELALGIDEREVIRDRPRKSVSVEETFIADLTQWHQCKAELALLHERLTRSLKRLGDDEVVGAVFIKIRFDDFSKTTVERSGVELSLPSVFRLAREGLSRKRRPVRLLGVGVRIQPASAQLGLFTDGRSANGTLVEVAPEVSAGGCKAA